MHGAYLGFGRFELLREVIRMRAKRGWVLSPYLVSTALVGLATCVAYGWPEMRKIHSMAPYMIAVLIASFYGGLGPSLLAIALSCISFACFIAPPVGLRISDPVDQVHLIQFIVVAVFFSLLNAQRVNANEKVRFMAQRLSLALEATQLGVWDLNVNSGEMWHSASVEEIHGRANERFAGGYEAFLGYVHAEERDFVHRTVTRAIESGKGFDIQYRIVLPGGASRWIGTHGHVFFDDMGNPERLVAVTTDITDRPVFVAPPARGPVAQPAEADSAMAERTLSAQMAVAK